MWCFHYVLWNVESLITVLMVTVMRQCNPSSLRECRNRQESMARRGTTAVGENYHKWPQGGCLRVTKRMKLFMWVILSFIRWPVGEISMWRNEPVNWGCVSWKAAFFIFFCFVLFLTILRICYRTIKGILGGCESLCLLSFFRFLKQFKIETIDSFNHERT